MTRMTQKAFQDYYTEEFSHCYGCGRLNNEGLKIKSYWDGDETVCSFTPHASHTALPGIVYGGLIASVIDCHSTGTAAAAAARAEGRAINSQPPIRFVTASLHIDYLSPTPIKGPLELRSKITEHTEKKVIVTTELSAQGRVCATGTVVAVKATKDLIDRLILQV